MRHHLDLAADLVWVGLSAVVAVYARDNFVRYGSHMAAIIPYAAIAVATFAFVFVVSGLHRTLWQVLKLAAAEGWLFPHQATRGAEWA